MFVCHVLGIEARSELYLRFDSSGISRVSRVDCRFHGIGLKAANFTSRDTVKKEGPWQGVEGGGWRVEGGGWREEGGGWRVEGGGWRVEGGG